ncbi:hypothetical protein ACFY3G_53050 [Streptomyces phaeochromogenes]|uniref:hypothetical protein n=1 Tax=Streptomyces phaeochromogenes TaxID=1923 RepID=UPI00367BC43B
MSDSLRPWRPKDFDDTCETCDAPPGQFCRPWCTTGYTAADALREAEREAEKARRESVTGTPPSEQLAAAIKGIPVPHHLLI